MVFSLHIRPEIGTLPSDADGPVTVGLNAYQLDKGTEMKREVRGRGASALAVLTVLSCGMPATAQVCVNPTTATSATEFGMVGDLNGNGVVDISDAMCATLTNLWYAAGQMGSAPGCLVVDPTAVDFDCSGSVQVSDVLNVVNIALVGVLPPSIDSDDDGCADNCLSCPDSLTHACVLEGDCFLQGDAHPTDPCLECVAGDPAEFACLLAEPTGSVVQSSGFTSAQASWSGGTGYVNCNLQIQDAGGSWQTVQSNVNCDSGSWSGSFSPGGGWSSLGVRLTHDGSTPLVTLGSVSCTTTAPTSSPDGRDNDCNGQVDNSTSSTSQSCSNQTVSGCGSGQFCHRYSGGGCINPPGPGMSSTLPPAPNWQTQGCYSFTAAQLNAGKCNPGSSYGIFWQQTSGCSSTQQVCNNITTFTYY